MIATTNHNHFFAIVALHNNTPAKFLLWKLVKLLTGLDLCCDVTDVAVMLKQKNLQKLSVKHLEWKR